MPGFGPRGGDIDSQGVVWVTLASGHIGSFDRRKCKAPLNGPKATGDHCPEGWSFYQYPGPGFEGIGENSAESSYYSWVDQHDTFGLGKDVPMSTANLMDGLVALKDGKMISLRVPYPLGFYAKGFDCRIDDPNAGWKGRGLSKSANPKRKLARSWELIEVDLGGGAELVGINTIHPNALAAEAIAAGAVAELAGYASLRREVKYGKNSRVDFLLEAPARPPCYVEIKNVHLMREPGLAEFPDAVTKRGAKHLVELGEMAAAGARAVMLFLIQIGSARRFKLARDIDPAYGAAFDAARSMGVEAIAYRCGISCEGIEVAEPVPIAE